MYKDVQKKYTSPSVDIQCYVLL